MNAKKQNLKKKIKPFLRPFVGPAFHLLHFQIFGKRVFLNKYTRRLPPVERLFRAMEWRILLAQTAEERAKEYKKWNKQNYPKSQLLKRQKKDQKQFKYRPKISVVVPTYNTDIDFLHECIKSVQNQTYNNWQLCMADDASTDPEVVKVIKRFASRDKRIVYTERSENGHICKASNSALELASGKFVALLDHDDVLWPNALYEVVELLNKDRKIDFVYTDEDKIEETGKEHMEPFFKPDWSPYFLRSVNYITHFSVIRKSIVDKVGGFRPGYEGAQDWDLFLRVSRTTDRIKHIPKVLYSWRKSDTSTAKQPSVKDYAYVNQRKALVDDVESRGFKADIDWEIPLSMWRIKYSLKNKSRVSIVIPTKNQYNFIAGCLKSIDEKTTYKNIEVIIVDTGSKDKKVWDLYEEYKKKWSHLRVEKWKKEFNFAAVCNFGASFAKGKYLLFLNNDTEVITPSWIEDMLGYAQQDNAGAVGCKLLYPDGRLQHGGIVLGVGGQNGTPGIAGHYFPAFRDHPPQDHAQQLYVGGTREFMAVTAACVMIEKNKLEAVKGFDAKFKIAFNDVDFCLKLHKKGLQNIYLPHVKLFHYESVSVGQPGSKQRDVGVFAKEIQLMLKKWRPIIENDPYYHPEFRRDIASARLRLK